MKHPKDNAGYKIARRTGPGRGWVTVYTTRRPREKAAQEVWSTTGQPWAVACEAHGVAVGAETRTAAEGIMRAGSASFCDHCRAVAAADDVDLVTAQGNGESNAHEQAARWRKLAHLYAALYKHGIPIDRTMRLGRNQLRLIAKLVGVAAPSDTTIKLLRDTLRNVPPPREGITK